MAAIERLKKKQEPQISVALLRMRTGKRGMMMPNAPEMEDEQDDEEEDAQETEDSTTTESESETMMESEPKMMKKETGSDTCACLQGILDATFSFYMTAHKFHWNLECSDFPQFHEFFGDIYNEAFSAVDDIAEKMRQLGDMADVTKIEPGNATDLCSMVKTLAEMKEGLVMLCKDGVKIADEDNEPGVANFIAGRVEAHQKNAWMLRSSMRDD